MAVSDFFTRLGRGIDTFTEFTGRAISWLTIAMMVLTVAVVLLRRVFDMGSIALQESVIYLHAAVFLVGAAYTLKHGSHVRVDIFYRKMSERQQAIVDLAGTVLLLFPVTAVIFYLSLDYVIASWAVREVSNDAAGLPYVYLLKSLMLVMPCLLALQGLAEIIRNLLFLLHKGQDHSRQSGDLV